jgi:recombination protein RecA
MTKTNLVKEEMRKKGFKIKLASELKEDEKIKTGVFVLDYVLDGGIYRGEGGHRIEFYGKESSGKTTFSLYVIKRFQELKKKCIYINAENSYDKLWAEMIGVDNTKLELAYPENLEEAGDMLVEFIPKYDLIVVDSIPSLITQEELDGTMTDNKYMASQAKVFAPMMRKLYSATQEHFTTIIFINQMREKVGIAYGNPNITPGGRALKHYYNTRIEFRLGQPIDEGTKEEKERLGYEVHLRCEKNKRGKPYRSGVVDFYIEGEVKNKKSLLYAGIKYGIILQAGAIYTYGEQKFKGREDIFEKLAEKDWNKVEEEIWKRLK